MGFEIRQAEVKDLVWVNSTYKTIDFLPSTLENEIVAIAFIDDIKVGLGRIAVVDKRSCELGGMYVNPGFRRKGIARKIVEYLIKHAQKRTIYCVPFVHLSVFYESFGFRKIKLDIATPQKIKKKLEFAKKTYKEPTLLLVMRR